MGIEIADDKIQIFVHTYKLIMLICSVNSQGKFALELNDGILTLLQLVRGIQQPQLGSLFIVQAAVLRVQAKCEAHQQDENPTC